MSHLDRKEIDTEWYRSALFNASELGRMALRTLITLNSGAFVVLLTFIGNSAAQSQFAVPLESLRIAMFCFLGGIVSTFLVLAIAYTVALTANPYKGSGVLPDWLTFIGYYLLSAAALVLFVYGVAKIVVNVQAA